MAAEKGFDDAAVILTEDMVFVPAYRSFCEENVCGKYDVLPTCPPHCGSPDDMKVRALKYSHALVLQTILEGDCYDGRLTREAKLRHNIMTGEFIAGMKEMISGDILMMGSGPYKEASCMSAYCLDAQNTAELAGMDCWKDDGRSRFFSLLLFNE